MKKTSKAKITLGTVLVIISSLFYASYGVWATLMGNYFSGYTASALRSILVLLILLPIAYFRHQLEPLNLRKNWKNIASMIAASTLIWGLLYYSVLNSGVGISATVNFAALVIGMVLFGWLLAGEKFTSSKAISLVVGMIGLSLIFIQNFSGSIGLLPLLAALVSGLAAGATMVLAKQLPYNSTQATCVVWATSVLANVPMMFILKEPFPVVGLHIEWVYLLLFAVCSVLASWMLVHALKYIDAGIAGILGLLEIVFGIMLGVIFFSERVELLTGIGAIIILFASGFPYLYDLIKKNLLKRW